MVKLSFIPSQSILRLHHYYVSNALRHASAENRSKRKQARSAKLFCSFFCLLVLLRQLIRPCMSSDAQLLIDVTACNITLNP